MPRPRTVLLGLFALAAVPFALTVGPGYSQQPGGGGGGAQGPVQFDTADLVTLNGFYYPGKGKGTVLLLHALGEDSSKAEWVNLAKALNKKGYAVLRFDFRGHGQSTTVDPGNAARGLPGFWTYKENNVLYKNPKHPKTIDAKMFAKNGNYLPILANDVEAAKAWLDSQGESGPLILIGAKEGATVGAIWLNAAFNCFPIVADPMTFQKVPDLRNPVGKNVKAAVWLSMSSTVGRTTFPISTILTTAGKENKTPVWFLYASSDSKAKSTAKSCVKALKNKSKNVAESKIDGAQRLAGSALLTRSLGTTNAIITYLDSLPQQRMPRRGGMVEGYVWQTRFGQVPARLGDRLNFFDFRSFSGRR